MSFKKKGRLDRRKKERDLAAARGGFLIKSLYEKRATRGQKKKFVS